MTEATENRSQLNRNLAQMLKGGVIMDVTTPEQAHIAEEAGACAVMALERPENDQGHPGSRKHPGYGEVPHWPFRRSSDS